MAAGRGDVGPEGLAPEATLRLLHPAALRRVDGRWRPLSFADAAMFALLALGGTQSRRQLAQWAYPGKALKLAQGAWRKQLFLLQEQAGRPLVEGSGDPLRLAAGVVTDLDDPGRWLDHDPHALQAPLLPNRADDPRADLVEALAPADETWQHRLSDALVQQALAREQQQRLAEALVLARRLVALTPLAEHGVRLLMRLHYRRSDHGAALAAFEQCCRVLDQELGVQPSPETQALADEIRRAAVRSAAPVPPLPLALRHPPHTVGRARELVRAEAVWANTGVLLLTGVAGIGKSRLFDELVQRWQVPVVLCARPLPSGADHALLGQLAAALLALPVGDAGHDPDADLVLTWLAQPLPKPRPAVPLNEDRLLRALDHRLERCGVGAGAPLAIAIDDLQFADTESLAVIARLGPARAGRLRWLFTCRSHELPAPMQHWLAALAEGADDPQLALGELDPAALAELLGPLDLAEPARARWAEALRAHCGGHPLSLLQLLRALHASGALSAQHPPARLPLPHEALHRSARQLDRCSERAQQLAFLVALADGCFSDQLAVDIMGGSAIELVVPWRQLESLGLLRGNGFSHELMRQAVLEAVPAALAPALHADIARALARRGSAPAARAPHWQAAGEWLLAAEDHAAAAADSLAVGLHPKGRDQLLQAAELFERAGHRAPAYDARYRAGRITLECVSTEAARQAAESMLAAAQDDRERCLAWCLASLVAAERHDPGALDSARQAQGAAQRIADMPLVARADFLEALALYQAGRHPESLACQQALRPRWALLVPEERADAVDLLAMCLAAMGKRTEAVALGRQALDAARHQHDARRAMNAALQLGIHLGVLARPHEAVQAVEQALVAARQAGLEAGYLPMCEMTRASLLADLGRLDEAIEAGDRAMAGLRGSQHAVWLWNCENKRADIFVQLGRADLAGQLLPELPAAAPAWARAMRLDRQAQVVEARDGAALPLLDRAVTLLEQAGEQFQPLVLQRLRLNRARVAGGGAALAGAREVRTWAQAQGNVVLARLAALVEVEALLEPDPAAAGRCADALAAEARSGHSGDPGLDWQVATFYLPELWWGLVRAWQGGGRPAAARALAQDAVRWIGQVAAHHVPELFRNPFTTRNKVNAALIDWLRAGPGAGRG